MARPVSLPLFWRVVATNGAVFAAGTLALVLSPVTVSTRPVVSELVVLGCGLLVIVVVNAVLLRSVLGPLDRLRSAMAATDLRRPGQRLPETGAGPGLALVAGYNAMLDRLEEERTTSTALALQAQEAERQRIAQELHDEVGQSLTAVLLGLRQARDLAAPEVAAELDLVRETTRTSLDEVRRISQRLRPGVLADLGLLSALSSLGSDLTAHTGTPVVRGFLPGLPELSGAAELVVYRVAQEALTNVARHARAREVQLGLSRRGDWLVLRVADDGIGGAGSYGAGIQGMRERARIVGGRLELRSRDGGGTEVLLEVPLTPADTPGSDPREASE